MSVVGFLVVGAAFGAATSLLNAWSGHYADLSSREATISGASPLEVASTLLDSGWAWAGMAVGVGWLFTRADRAPGVELAVGAAAGALALFAATAAYGAVDAVREGGASDWLLAQSVVWWVASFVFGAPLGAVGACAKRPTAVGLLARLTVPAGAAAQMLVLPPGRNERITQIGQAVVGTAAVAAAALAVGFFLVTRRRSTGAPGAGAR
ncbi:hypothetical protein [Actinomadura harenae]|uniref:Uncharacterized protein n=1 Tax=Actinomadura harenae TaxID=2483351 RepID=A0A3M2MBZ8_9ACTN|nr:hypothetical protein [Actinomadura harenae]RMI47244.1 hypothetical protein EBO15_03405 [Actinomadura harenae]